MRRLRVTFYASDVEVHPLHTLLAERAYVESAQMVHWNAAGETLTHVFRVEGDRERFAAELAEMPEVCSFDLTPVEGERFYAYVRAETTPLQREMFRTYEEGGLVVTSPLQHTDGGGVSFDVVGTPAALQAAFESAPDGVRVDVERVGGSGADGADAALGALSPRQREAVAAALELGYYDVPRTASSEAVAERLDCAPSTAAEHLRKAESNVLRALFEGE
ncbi:MULTISPECIES: helix-turn-helix domain-containing protein [Halorussus]|uniref:helix-turn-helix domain-containing protein n=1 Tax=Halorussus TaxID=1070314 RepID=UPI0020A02709|nr:helix-turn-helix domain-containing protein [Halorussus vallis]USZ76440.1 helix-turn-helix domain-containing protein [Halorussus vallis]